MNGQTAQQGQHAAHRQPGAKPLTLAASSVTWSPSLACVCPSTPAARLLFFFQAEDGIRDTSVTGVQTCALPIQAEDGIRRYIGDWSSDVCSSDLPSKEIASGTLNAILRQLGLKGR